MSGKTKIVVLKMREVLTSLLFVAIGVVLVVFLITTFAKKNQDKLDKLPEVDNPELQEGNLEGALYIPGTYSTEVVLGKENVTLSVTVEKDAISSVALSEKTEAVDTLYPLLEPTLADINEQLAETGSLEGVSSSTDNRYTSMVLLQAIEASVNQAKIENE